MRLGTCGDCRGDPDHSGVEDPEKKWTTTTNQQLTNTTEESFPSPHPLYYKILLLNLYLCFPLLAFFLQCNNLDSSVA